MNMYTIIQCKCGAVRYIRSNQKTYYCFKCRKTRKTKNAVIIYETTTPQKASEIVKFIKSNGLNTFFNLFDDSF